MPNADPYFTRDVAKQIVKDALLIVASFDGNDIERFTFRRFSDFHKRVFLHAVRIGVNQVIYPGYGFYNVTLNDNSIGTWPTVGDCITWLLSNKTVRQGSTTTLSEGELLP